MTSFKRNRIVADKAFTDPAGVTHTGVIGGGTQVTVGDTGDHETIQGAHDAVDAGNEIFIQPDYDESKESFPVTVTKAHSYRMSGRDQISLPSGVTGFVIDIGTNEFPGTKFHNVNIDSGATAVQHDDGRHCRYYDCRFEHQTDHAFTLNEGGTVDSISNKFYGCVFEDAGRAGLNMGSTAHGAAFYSCTFEQNTNRGVDMDVQTNIGFYDCTFQLNGKHGLHCGSGANVLVSKCYFEDNNTADGTGEIAVDDVEGLTVETCFFQGFNNKPNAIQMSTASASAKFELAGTCVFRNYTGAAIDFVDIEDAEVNEGQHTLDGVSSLYTGATSGRVRSDGVITVRNLANTDGAFEGDRGLDDGTNTTSGNVEMAVWDSSLNAGAGGWFTQGGDII